MVNSEAESVEIDDWTQLQQRITQPTEAALDIETLIARMTILRRLATRRDPLPVATASKPSVRGPSTDGVVSLSRGVDVPRSHQLGPRIGPTASRSVSQHDL